jgi:uncharacterized protein
MGLQFTWDENKASSNFRKHKVGFEEASTLFYNPLACIFDDEDHSQEENREIIIGRSMKDRLLIVGFTELKEDRIRIITARIATKRERKEYEKKH